MTEQERIEILNKHLPKDFIDLYFYVLYDDPFYLPDSLLKENSNTRMAVNKPLLNERMKDLVLLLARAILNQ